MKLENPSIKHGSDFLCTGGIFASQVADKLPMTWQALKDAGLFNPQAKYILNDSNLEGSLPIWITME